MNLVPKTSVGVLVVFGILLFAMFAVYTTTWPALLLSAVVVILAVGAIYYVGFRIDKLLKHGF